MIWNWLLSVLSRVPGPRRIRVRVWARILAVLTLAGLVALLFTVVFPMVDELLSPIPNL